MIEASIYIVYSVSSASIQHWHNDTIMKPPPPSMTYDVSHNLTHCHPLVLRIPFQLLFFKQPVSCTEPSVVGSASLIPYEAGLRNINLGRWLWCITLGKINKWWIYYYIGINNITGLDRSSMFNQIFSLVKLLSYIKHSWLNF